MLHRPGEITYYDELGVSPNATPEEIREAFHLLARLLHPDQHTDIQLKTMAERQMRRLNPIYAVLSDPERRQRYDEDLEDGFPVPIIVNAAPATNFRRLIGRGAWVLAILITAGVLIWLAAEGSPVPQLRAHAAETDESVKSQKPSESPVDSSREMAQLRSDLKSLEWQRDAAIRELGRLRGNNAVRKAETGLPPASALDHIPTPIATELPTLASLSNVNPLPAPVKRDVPAPNRGLAGFWFYVQPPDGQKNKNRALYPPEYIEATISEAGGVTHGRYRSRFRIVDQAISPEVNFSFTGVFSGSTMTCPWTGPAGAHGELTLKLESENSIKIDWKATELGNQQGLVSGTATLTRRIEN